MMFYLFIIGVISILGQVVILRELNVAFYGVELIYILAMGIWLFWTAAGALVGRRAYVPPVSVVSALLIVFAMLLPIEVAAIRGIRLLFHGIPGSYLPFGQQLIAISLTLLPVGILLGLLFQWAAKSYITRKKTLAMAYAIESAGAILGGFASTLLLQFGVQNFVIAMLCSMLTISSSLICQVSYLPGRWSRANTVGMAALGGLIMVFFASWEMDRQMTRWTHPHLLDTQDSPYGRITIEARAGQFVVFENDMLGFETESTAAEEFVHLAAIQHRHPRQVLVAGGGLEGTVREVLKHSPQRVDYVELNAVLLDLARKHLPETHLKFLESETVHVYHADPRRFLLEPETPSAPKAYDLILVGMSEPASGQSNRFYTREYFRQCSDRLRPGGILAFRLRSSENLWTQFLSYRNTSIWLALRSVFHDVLVLPGMTNIVLGSDAPLIRDPDKLIEEFNKREIRTRLITPPYIRYVLTNDRFSEIANQLSSTNAFPNTDRRPVCYQYSCMIWLSKFIPGMIHWNYSLASVSNWVWIISCICIIVCICVLIRIARGHLRFKKILLTALAGFIGMILETMLMLHYQVKSGVLFQNIGILLMVFMTGLAVGSASMMKLAVKSEIPWFGHHQSPKNPVSNDNDMTMGQNLGSGLFLSFGMLSLVFIGMSTSGHASGLCIISFLLFIDGFLVSGVFAFASLARVKDRKADASRLYAADLLGGCVGSLLGSLVLIPFFGMEGTAFMMTGLALIALFII